MRTGLERALKWISVCHTSRCFSPENMLSAVMAVKWFMSVRSNESNVVIGCSVVVKEFGDKLEAYGDRLEGFGDRLEAYIDSGGILGAETLVDMG